LVCYNHLSMEQARIFITGGAGFIGANLAAHYLKLGRPVTLYDNLSRPGVSHNLKWLGSLNPSKLKLIQADVTDFAKLKTTIKGHTHVFHCAGQTAVTTSISNPRYDFAVNALGTFNLLEAVRATIPRAIVIYTSTNKVYGSVPRLKTRELSTRYQAIHHPIINESEPLDFHSPYGCSKGSADQYVRDYARIFNLKTIVFRQSCIYGAHQFGVEDQGWVAHFTSLMIQKKPITIFGNGKQVRDLLYIDDLIKAFDLAITHINRTRGQVYNLGGGPDHTISLLDLIDKLKELSRYNPIINSQPPRQGDQNYYVSDITKAFREFNWQPQVSIGQGLSILFHWLADYLAPKTKS